MRHMLSKFLTRDISRRNLLPGPLTISHRLLSDKNDRSGRKSSKKYGDTLALPKTEFPLSMKNVAAREIDIQNDCNFEDLYTWQLENNKGRKFVLHDGPPYANGKPHVGHAINKILKDITNRYHVLRGHRVNFIPGWDCHGLPIELKALQNQGNQKLTPLQVRDRARKFAENAIQLQMKAFKRWGIMADWKNCYYTFNPEYEVKELDVFYNMYEKGLIYIGMLPVYWSPSSKTCLAESELEYNNDHVSTAVYIKCKLSDIPSTLAQHLEPGSSVYAVIWTTTPWSIPANQAICYNKDISYAVLKDQSTGDLFICEEVFISKFEAKLQKSFKRVSSFSGGDLFGASYHHPLTNEVLPFHHADHVIPDKGTGLVHTAPSHGHDDYNFAKELGIDVKNLLDDEGRYTDSAGPDLAGKVVGDKDTEIEVLKCLKDHIVYTEKFTHSYPYDWRTKKPVIIRVSRQWFIDTQRLKHRAKKYLSDITITPARSIAGMLGQLESRPHWCISRQRVWGLPIPVFYHKQTKKPLITSEIFNHVRQLIEKNGSDCWWSISDEELLPSALLEKESLGRTEDYERGQDILDIWFDSGTSWAAVIGSESPVDIYMEGLDQFGGWFQTSLLTSVAVQNKAPYKSLVIHGFTMDEEGRKMSKSLGNVVDPEIVITGGKNKQKEPGFGADVLRWWAAMSCLQTTTTIGHHKLSTISNDLFEMRKTLRFLLGNISVKNESDLMEYCLLWPQDKYMLFKLYQLVNDVTDLYESFGYTQILQCVDKFCRNDISRFYSTIIKDRCYCDSNDGPSRQSSLTTQYHILNVVVKLLAPIIPHLTEELYQYYPPNRRKYDTFLREMMEDVSVKKYGVISFYVNFTKDVPDQMYSYLQTLVINFCKYLHNLTLHLLFTVYSCCGKASADVDSVFKDGWIDLPPEWNSEDVVHTLSPVLDIKDHFMDIIGEESPSEFDVMIYASSLLQEKLHELQSDHTSSHSPLCEVFQSASTTLLDKPPPVIAEDVQLVDGVCQVHMKDGFKHPEKYVIVLSATDKFLCGRCRRFTASSQNTPCDRCLTVMSDGWE